MTRAPTSMKFGRCSGRASRRCCSGGQAGRKASARTRFSPTTGNRARTTPRSSTSTTRTCPTPLGEESQWGTHTAREFKKSMLIVRNSDSHWEFDPTSSKSTPGRAATTTCVLFPHDKLPILNGKSPPCAERRRRRGDRRVRRLRGRGRPRSATTPGHRLLDKGEPAKPKGWPSGVAPFASFTGSSGPLQMRRCRHGQGRRRSTATVRRGKGGGAMDLALPARGRASRPTSRPVRSTTSRSTTMPRRSATAPVRPPRLAGR